MKIIYVFFLLFLFLVTGCDNPVEHNNSKLQISFKNSSVYKLNNLKVSNKLIGNLSSNSSSRLIVFEKFGFDSGMPDEDASADINGKILTNHYRGYWCGTEKININSGKYLIEVEVLDTMLYLYCKNAPKIDYP
jgi:hypothetical protein